MINFKRVRAYKSVHNAYLTINVSEVLIQARASDLNLINEPAQLTGYQPHKRGWEAAKRPTSPLSNYK
jgi:hypothetical protein